MAGADQRTVNVSGQGLMREYTCAAALSVGFVVEHAATAGVIQVSSGAGDDYKGGTMIVTEAPERGKGIYSTGTTENTYAIGEQVPTITVIPGNHYLVMLTSGQTITRGNELEIANTGRAIVAAGTNLPMFTALESLSPSEHALILVEAL